MPDAVVIGSGPNGLVAANLLADRGWDVLVCEAADSPGGAVRSEQLMEPGFVNDVFSAFYPLAVASPAIAGLGLEEFGLRWRRAPLVLAHPAADGTCPVLSTALDETAASLDAFHQGDGDAWCRLFTRWQRTRDGVIGSLFTPMPPVRASARLARGTIADGPLHFARFSLLSVRRLAEEEFGSAQAQRLLAGAALHSDLAPDDTLSGFFGWILCSLGQEVGWPVPEGGAGALTRALVRRLEARGGRVRCNAPIDNVVVRRGRAVAVRIGTEEIPAGKAVLADVDAPRLYLRLIGPEHLPSRFVRSLRRFAWDDAVCKVDWNLDAPVPWTAPEARRAGTLHIADSIDEMTDTTAQIARGLVPSRPFLLVGQQSMTDSTRMPAGCETLWAYTHLPRAINGDAAGEFDASISDIDRAERIADRMQARIEALAPGFTSSIRHRHVLMPEDLERRNPNLVGGAINGGTARLSQQLVFRPIPGLGRAETPVKRLYLASASAHPGGGVHGACGANAARAAVFHDRVRRWMPTGD